MRNSSLVMLLTVCTLLIAGCTPDAHTNAGAAEAEFERVADSAGSSGVTLKSDRSLYRQGDKIVFWVENRTEHDLWFVDDNFGVRGYSHEKATGNWREVDLSNRIINPQPLKLPAHHLLDANLGHLDTDFFTQSGSIRLLVQVCLARERLDKPCADYSAYRDIVVNSR